MLVKNEGSMKNKQSRNTCNIGLKTQNKDKTKRHNKENEKDEQYAPHQKSRGEPRCLKENAVPVSHIIINNNNNNKFSFHRYM